MQAQKRAGSDGEIVETGGRKKRTRPDGKTQARRALDVPGGRRRAGESERNCLRREIREELPKLKLGPLKLWKEVKAKNRRSGRRMSDAIFLAKKVSGRLKVGDKKEIDRAVWRKPRGFRLTPTSRYICDKLFPRRGRR